MVTERLYNMEDASGIWVGTVVFVGLYFVLALPVSLYARSHTKDPRQVNDNYKLGWILSAVAVICMWLLWLCCYMHQMYPLATPKLE